MGHTESNGPHPTNRLDDLIWTDTMTEQAEGWLVGPLSQEDLWSEYAEGWVPARRFGLPTGSGDTLKVRLIDDYTLPQTNSACSVDERVCLDDLDSIGALGKYMLMKAG